MVTVTCIDKDCPNGGIDYNVPGKPPFVECGGCGVHLAPYDERDDPPALEWIPGPVADFPDPPA